MHRLEVEIVAGVCLQISQVLAVAGPFQRPQEDRIKRVAHQVRLHLCRGSSQTFRLSVFLVQIRTGRRIVEIPMNTDLWMRLTCYQRNLLLLYRSKYFLQRRKLLMNFALWSRPHHCGLHQKRCRVRIIIFQTKVL